MRVKHKPWAKEYIEDNKNIFINSYIEDESLSKLLEKYTAVCMEIGCGKGKFIYEMAKLNPENLYIAVEKQASVLVSAAKKQEENPLNNLKFYSGDIFDLNENTLLRKKLDKIYINFSDPWPKKRHIKRRLTYEKFLNLYYNLLKDNGEIEQKTDNDKLFEFSLLSFNKYKKYEFIELYLDLHSEDKFNVTTEYENKFSQAGIKIKYLRVRKV